MLTVGYIGENKCLNEKSLQFSGKINQINHLWVEACHRAVCDRLETRDYTAKLIAHRVK